MRHSISYILVLVIFTSSCKNSKVTANLAINDSIKKFISDTVSRLKLDIKNEMNYHYMYNTSEAIKSNFFDGWIYTFSIAQRKFRLKLDVESDSINIEYFENGIWIKNTSFEIRDEFDTTVDYNHDGFKDIYSEAQGWNFINFYMPQKKTFSQQYQMLGDAEYLIDTSMQLYVNYREPYHQCNTYSSQLLDYKNTIPTIHFLLSGETYTNDDGCIMDSINVIKLYRYNQLKDTLLLIETIKPKNPKVFDYENYWESNYKRLMGYH